MRVVALPTKTNFRGINVREVALFKGEYGWGEFSPFLEYGYEESAPWLQCAVEAATKPLPKLYRTSVKVNGTIPALNEASELERIVNSFPGVETFKVKVGDNLPEDIVRLAKVRALAPKAKLRIDVNGNWNVATAITNLRAIFENIGPLEYVEQPCATIAELRELKEKLKLDIPIAGDEVLRKAADPFKVDLTGAVDILALKVQPLGGIARAHKLAQHHNLPIVVSSALESAVGISHGLALAASFEEINFDCGLATGSLLSANVGDLPIVNGEIEVKRIEPNFDSLEVSPERYKWWQDRVMKTWEQIS
ncbi:MAG: o-succinylbenzoate synthase [Actinobacteria bacterium]|nr:o-succinylbenzoate synthase [Actinomycetota bacterium]MSV70475.1 o-succinylbenzoate synthase [Actinomycetota bacterium]MSW13356.1 o-succinylbenzoate synthase [Actinomycetota bacterium]MSX46344.1 o-succinylbenzoate synthase [Actinomycetota bacterium]MSX90448.1 o-succinylbenzoate synthase [Actinomycetota bacterium]